MFGTCISLQVKRELSALEEQVAPLVVQYEAERARLEEIRRLQAKREQVRTAAVLHSLAPESSHCIAQQRRSVSLAPQSTHRITQQRHYASRAPQSTHHMPGKCLG